MKIDVHHHFIPLFYRKALERAGVGTQGLPTWSPQRSLDMMDQAGIERAWLSLSSPGVWLGSDEEARRLSRACNDYAASVIRQHPGRFGALAALPLPDLAAALEELAYALDALKLDGVSLLSNVNGIYVGDPELDAVLAELDRSKADVLLHANAIPDSNENAPLYPWPEYPIDIARAYARLVLSDAFQRFPRIKWILADSGGVIPFLADRLSRAHYTDGEKLRWARIAKDLVLRRNGGLTLAQNVDYDSVSTSDPVVRAALERLVPKTRIRFGSDFPYSTPLVGRT